MIPDCTRRGIEVRLGFFRCESNRLTHPELGIVAIATCGICPYRNLPDREGTRGAAPDPRFTTACIHRGEVLEVVGPEIKGKAKKEVEMFDRVETIRIVGPGSYELNIEKMAKSDERIVGVGGEEGSYIIDLMSMAKDAVPRKKTTKKK